MLSFKPKLVTQRYFIILLFLSAIEATRNGKRIGEIDIKAYREKAKQMFYHAYNGYLNHAYPYDELKPLTCKGHDTWGSYSLTLIDALDTLVVMGNHSEFRRVAQLLIDKGESFFDMDINASVFETNIRIVGGLLSAHLLMGQAEMVLEPAWPCSGPLLRMAENIARKILPAFDTPTGMPYGTVNLRHGVPKGETTVTCTAGVGTFLIEFGALSRLTGDPIFEKTAVRAIRALWKYRSPLGLLGNHIDVSTGKWTALDSGIGGGVDSYFEYLVKGAVMFNIPEFLHMFREYEMSIKRYLKRDDWYMWAHMTKGTISLPLFTSLDGYWPGVQSMLGNIDEAMKTIHNFHQVWRQFGFTPEYYNIPNAEVHQGREGYPLRPEIVESAMYLYRATRDPFLLEVGRDILEGIEAGAKTSCGYATVKDVRDHRLEDRMESFFLAETTKYLYLLFDPDNFMHENGSQGQLVHTPGGVCVVGAGGYVFNTEAHPIDLAAVHCCSAEKREEDRLLHDMEDNLDLLSILGITDGEAEGNMDMYGFWEESGVRDTVKEPIREGSEELLSTEHGESIEDLIKMVRERYTKNLKETCGRDSEEGCLEVAEEQAELDEDDEEHSGDGYDDADFEDLGVDEEENKENESQNTKASTSPPEKQVQYHQSKPVDLSQFRVDELRLLQTFLINHQLLLVDNMISEISSKIRLAFQATEQEQTANDIALKLDIANKQTSKEEREVKEAAKFEDQSSFEKLQGSYEKDVDDDDDNDSDIMHNVEKDKTVEDTDEAQSQLKEPQVVVVQVSSTSQSPDSERKTDQVDNSLKSRSGMSEETVETSEAVGRFKSHIQQQLQHEDEQLDQKKKQSQGQESSQIVSADNPSPLDKRTNLLSITKKFLQIFSRSFNISDNNDNSPSDNSPSAAGLHAVLSNYSLNYFNDPWVMHCPAQPFHHRLSIYGEMFSDET